ncbi:MAG: aminodeoxychorismate/anthranilate synthase component II [Zymomonas mobilis subsp. pomaceae]|uniref:Glutamine amidotransferase of anthranilate synthase n=1 Tax=Zymomonas mobilis subsp. pomaceae (strain ATCC 29192 / DSM 22645 / JCM 10191 / CCUG 17912 / NBRC 13757 / NCIMB 11200 / NRRL B-4491 / Barker I) TaxID=579138 RepID=F8ETT1_ZYMMT|nr:aminodeoxychorismate/anthranilate synthase component II [Zymomonas mobilis]AEI38028.1 glutamine amidotransferase of anthranilate synthase [Zymomonas mobilis subsp. pomaceae ATCC 29192]MDX5949395.1 aminodeoxychorismate/anthranilate synthase component II [Zymomonas mobilis subsp. pomaceae]GEB89138.1 aminodeoxychorismate/anthranilate synthase component II [Zymomonas mobilis subsp. pomaceae]
MLLIIDNYDSFVFNLARYFERLGKKTMIIRRDEVTMKDIRHLNPKAIIISPGPCSPKEADISVEVVRVFSGKIPILGVCLGHQCIGSAFGGIITRAKNPMHGRATEIRHQGKSLFKNLPMPLKAGRYHSLIVQPTLAMNSHLITEALSPDGEIMALSHVAHPTYGVQFHPESILTEYGYEILKNFFALEEAFHANMAKRGTGG